MVKLRGLDLRVGFGGDLLGIGDGLGRGQSLGGQDFGDNCAHEYDDSKECESAHGFVSFGRESAEKV